MKTLLFIIDPQHDFVNPDGTLYVPGSESAILEIEKLIVQGGNEISDIIISQDTHHKYHIAHPGFWSQKPKPFTKISSQDYVNGLYTAVMYPPTKDKPVDPFIQQYLESLEEPLTIWPEHCLEGSWGWAFPASLVEVIHNWEMLCRPARTFKIYQKGSEPLFEAFSLFTKRPILQDEVYANVESFCGYDRIIICGVAKDVCVANTVRDMIQSGLYDNKLVFFNDGMAAIDPSSPMMKIFEDAISNHGATEM